MIFPILNYAETHYKPSFLKSAYYRTHPEIIFDVPHTLKLQKQKELPVFCIVKDAEKFPCTITSIILYLQSGSICRKITISDTEIYVDKPYLATEFAANIPKDFFNKHVYITVIAEYKLSNNTTHTCINDNYRGMPYSPFRTYICNENDCFPQNWYKGDCHYHSNYTNDQVEFGADIKSAKSAAKALGLDWFFVTDHSYDLDDKEDNCLQNDPELTKWNKLTNEINTLSDEDVCVILAEEVSIGSTENKNLHLIAVRPEQFIPGYGDSAETWGKTEPTVSIKDVEQYKPKLLIAAHPFEPVSYLQSLSFSFRRSEWKQPDFIAGNVNILQIINGSNKSHINRSIKKWVDLLLKGNMYFITAGNDAHGNFGLQRQVKLPFIQLESKIEQLFGKWFTAFKHNSNNPADGIRNGCMILSNGPFLDFILKTDTGEYEIGSTIKYSPQLDFSYCTVSTSQFGKFTKVLLYIGDTDTRKETKVDLLKESAPEDYPQKGYIRMEGFTENGGRVITNPIWIS